MAAIFYWNFAYGSLPHCRTLEGFIRVFCFIRVTVSNESMVDESLKIYFCKQSKKQKNVGISHAMISKEGPKWLFSDRAMVLSN